MNYWLLKGNPTISNFAESINPGSIGLWWTKKTSKLAIGDKVFIWRTKDPRRIIGLGQINAIKEERDSHGTLEFWVQYFTPYLHPGVGRQDLEHDPDLLQSVLRFGVVATALPLTSFQAHRLLLLIDKLHTIEEVREVLRAWFPKAGEAPTRESG